MKPDASPFMVFTSGARAPTPTDGQRNHTKEPTRKSYVWQKKDGRRMRIINNPLLSVSAIIDALERIEHITGLKPGISYEVEYDDDSVTLTFFSRIVHLVSVDDMITEEQLYRLVSYYKDYCKDWQ
jgi:hypothetical protein